MKLFLLVFSILFIPFLAPATSTQIKVTKVKGKMALVEFEGPLTAGQNYSIVSSDIGATELKMGPRKYRFGFTFYFSSLKTKTSSIDYNPSELTINSDFGWNFEHYEVGPILGYSSISTGFGGSTTYLTVGGFYDYNFSENKQTSPYLFGAGIKLAYINIAPASGSTGLFLATVYPNIFWKWWAFGQSTALKMDIGYDIESGKDSAFSSTSSSGFKSTGALLFYF